MNHTILITGSIAAALWLAAQIWLLVRWNLRAKKELSLEVRLRKAKRRRRKMKRELRKLKQAFFRRDHCKHCGSEDNLHFHHPDPDTKPNDWHNLWNFGWSRIASYMEDVVVLCQTCHHLEHKRMAEGKGEATIDANLNEVQI